MSSIPQLWSQHSTLLHAEQVLEGCAKLMKLKMDNWSQSQVLKVAVRQQKIPKAMMHQSYSPKGQMIVPIPWDRSSGKGRDSVTNAGIWKNPMVSSYEVFYIKIVIAVVLCLLHGRHFKQCTQHSFILPYHNLVWKILLIFYKCRN